MCHKGCLLLFVVLRLFRWVLLISFLCFLLPNGVLIRLGLLSGLECFLFSSIFRPTCCLFRFLPFLRLVLCRMFLLQGEGVVFLGVRGLLLWVPRHLAMWQGVLLLFFGIFLWCPWGLFWGLLVYCLPYSLSLVQGGFFFVSLQPLFWWMLFWGSQMENYTFSAFIGYLCFSFSNHLYSFRVKNKREVEFWFLYLSISLLFYFLDNWTVYTKNNQ